MTKADTIMPDYVFSSNCCSLYMH